MKTKSIPAMITLTAGLITCIAGAVTHMEMIHFTKMLLIVLVVFYALGSIAKWIIDSNFKETTEEETTDGEETAEAFEEEETEHAAEEQKEK